MPFGMGCLMDEHEPLIRVMALHALGYCERLFYLEEVEEIRLADASVYAGRTLHEDLRHDEEERGEWTSREVASHRLGLVGKMDCLRRRDGALIPYEHKRGRSRKDGAEHSAWPSDKLQIAAYSMLLEEATGETVPEGRVRYHAENVTVRVPIDKDTRSAVHEAITRAHALRRSTERPPVADNDRLCLKCALAPVCLPEEERFVRDETWEPVRLFPADRELVTVHVAEHGARVGRSGDTLKIERSDEAARVFPIHEVGAVVLHGYSQITTQALHLCARHDIPVHWLSPAQKFVTGTAPGAGMVQRRLRQYQALSDPGVCLRLARKTVHAKIENSLRYVLRATQGTDRRESGIEPSLSIMRECLHLSARVEGIDALRGHEGVAGRAYFDAIDGLLRPEVPETMRPLGRSRRPPTDRFNALLSFGYALLYGAVLQAVVAVGLEPALGFLHAPRSSAHPLVLDLMELFRCILWDVPLIGSVNRLQWNVGADFSIAGGRVWLSDAGRRKAIRLFEERLEEHWKHPVVDYSLSYARLIELEVRLLEKEWAGAPGLYARMRVR